MNVDSLFLQGASHRVCEDYAVSEKIDDERAYIIVSDGCSSGMRSDVAARLLVLLAERIIRNEFMCSTGDFRDRLSGDQFLMLLERYYTTMFNLSNLQPTHRMIATLLVVIIDGAKMRVYMYGDGAVILDRRGSLEIRTVSYEQQAPRYPVYSFRRELETNYLIEYKNQIVRTNVLRLSESGMRNESVYCNAGDAEVRCGMTFDVATEDLDSIILSTDGLESFDGLGETESPDRAYLAKELVGFKTLKGEFLKRRVRALIEQLAKVKVVPQDDLGFAAATFKSKQL
jgi:hypothetical protein